MEMNTLQELIEQKAKRRLTEDLQAIARFVHGNRMLSDSSGDMLRLYLKNETGEGYQSIFIRDVLAFDNTWRRKLYQRWLPEYIKEETEGFLKKVEELSAQVEDLQSGLEDVQRRQNY